jgi:ABC-type multidrug transport system fused ATPase/permease subunit
LPRPFNRCIAQTLDATMAHRVITAATRCVQHTHRLVVLDRGRIVEQGSHDALFRQGGRYAALWRRQSAGFIDVATEQTAE